MLYGSLQPVTTFEIEVSRTSDAAAAGLDAAILAVAGEFASRATGASGGMGIAERLARLVGAIQSHFGHPNCEIFHVEELAGSAEYAAFRLHLPHYYSLAVPQTANWTIRALNLLIRNDQDTAAIEGLRAELAQLGVELRKRAPESLNTLNFILASWQLGISVSSVVANVLRFGLGRNARLLDSTYTDHTPVIGTKISRNKAATAVVLGQGGLPAPQHIIASSIDTACDAARRLGYPLVVKPIEHDGGQGVYAGLRDEASLMQAAKQTLLIAQQILVERHFEGCDFRLTVFDRKVIKVEQRIACGVVGDGASTIAELVTKTQASERFQKILHNYGRMPIALDEEAHGLLDEQNLAASSVVDVGRRVPLRRKNNVSAGGEQLAVPIEAVHPDNLALAVRAADLLILDLAGVDLLIPDIGVSWLQSGALICEVNAQPQIGVRTTPAIYSQLLSQIITDRGRIPVHLIIAERHDAVPFEALNRRAAQLGCNGIANGAGAWIDGTQIIARRLDAFAHLSMVLADPGVHGAIGVTTPAEIVRKGLPCARFDSILNLTGKALPAISAAIAPHVDRLVQ